MKKVVDAVSLTDRDLLVAVLSFTNEILVLTFVKTGLHVIQGNSISIPELVHDLFQLVSPIDKVTLSRQQLYELQLNMELCAPGQ